MAANQPMPKLKEKTGRADDIKLFFGGVYDGGNKLGRFVPGKYFN